MQAAKAWQHCFALRWTVPRRRYSLALPTATAAQGGGCTCTDLGDSNQPFRKNTARCCPHGHGAARLGCCAHIAVKVPLNDPAQLGEPSFCRHSVLQKQGSHRLDCGKSSMRPSEPKAVLPPLKGLEPLLDFHLL